jgi:hypothetical protein
VIDDKGEEEGLKISCAALVKPVWPVSKIGLTCLRWAPPASI